jgi:SAM-dependent methyltransferase
MLVCLDGARSPGAQETMSECSDILTELESWYQRDRGRNLYASIRETLEPVLETAFGYHLVQLGYTRQQPLFEHSRIRHQLYVAPQRGELIKLVAEHTELPLESDSIDVLIGHHCLEFGDHPHQVLREMHRVLTPQGQLLLVGFNPYSLLGAAQRLRAMAGNPLWRALRPVSRNRLLDWLHLLDCAEQDSSFLAPLPVVGEGRLGRYARRLNAWSEAHGLPFGSVYTLRAIKQVSGKVRPLRPALRSSRLMGLVVPKPAITPRHRNRSE